tara:strand:- start:3908 stop:4243 length:336 start_codon:yes stop_codon:yes gene_type:complete
MASNTKKENGLVGIATDSDEVYPTNEGDPTSGEGTGGNYENDDWFDLQRYRDAAGVAYEFSKKKMEDAGEQERLTIGKGGAEQRKSARQAQDFSESDEARDYMQARRSYTF